MVVQAQEPGAPDVRSMRRRMEQRVEIELGATRCRYQIPFHFVSLTHTNGTTPNQATDLT